MTHPNVVLVHRMFGAYAVGDRETITALLSPDVRWRTSWANEYDSTIEGPDAVIDHLFDQPHVDDQEMELVDTLVGDERVALLLRADNRRGDVRSVLESALVFRILDGRVRTVDEYVQDPAGLAALLRAPLEAATARG